MSGKAVPRRTIYDAVCGEGTPAARAEGHAQMVAAAFTDSRCGLGLVETFRLRMAS